MFISINGTNYESPIFVSDEKLSGIVNIMCKGSMYANQQTLKHGYITLPDGDRVGVVGDCVLNNGEIEYMRKISAINIRISREVAGCANEIITYIKKEKYIYNTLIVSPPSCGKTTILRDIARQLGNIYRVGIVDEREEIANGKDVGKHTVTLTGCDKSTGMLMLLRSMAPYIILVDEIGTKEDESALKKLLNAGVKIICTAHGFDEKDVLRRDVFKKLIEEKVFERIIVLSAKKGPGTLEKVVYA